MFYFRCRVKRILNGAQISNRNSEHNQINFSRHLSYQFIISLFRELLRRIRSAVPQDIIREETNKQCLLLAFLIPSKKEYGSMKFKTGQITRESNMRLHEHRLQIFADDMKPRRGSAPLEMNSNRARVSRSIGG